MLKKSNKKYISEVEDLQDFILLDYKGNPKYNSGIIYMPYISNIVSSSTNRNPNEEPTIRIQNNYEFTNNITKSDE